MGRVRAVTGFPVPALFQQHPDGFSYSQRHRIHRFPGTLSVVYFRGQRRDVNELSEGDLARQNLRI